MSQGELDFCEKKLGLSLRDVKEMFGETISEGTRLVAGRTLQLVIDAEFAELMRAERYQRTELRQGWRNGSRRRSLLATVGLLDLAIPRAREFNFQPSSIERYRRLEGTIEKGIKEMFIAGVSTRRVGDVLAVLLGARVSASTVSNIAKELDQQVREFANRPLADDFIFLFLDGISAKVRLELRKKRYMILVAYGIRADGSRELIAFQKVKGESFGCWSAFLANLKVRGLQGRQLKLIVMDGAEGLWQAAEEIYPLVEHQLCWVHKLRNVSNYCRKCYRQQCLREARTIMNAATAAMAAKRFRQWRARWKDKAPRAVNCLERDFDRLIPAFSFPESIRKMIRSTNVIERSFREVRRRIRPMGCFPNSASCNRLIYALFAFLNCKWQRQSAKIKAIKEVFKTAA